MAGAYAEKGLELSSSIQSSNPIEFEDRIRKLGWESGIMDYMGKDSCDNILKKIHHTMAKTFMTKIICPQLFTNSLWKCIPQINRFVIPALQSTDESKLESESKGKVGEESSKDEAGPSSGGQSSTQGSVGTN